MIGDDKLDNILILGSMHDFAELTKSCIDRGYYTIVCDNYKDGPAKQIAHKSYEIDIFDIDQLEKVCKENNVKGIVTGFSDILMEAYVLLCERLHLKCYLSQQQLTLMRNKDLMSKRLAEYGIKTMPYTLVSMEDIEDNINNICFPSIIKPIDGYGSRGVYRLYEQNEIQDYLPKTLQFSKLNKVMIEKFNNNIEYNFFAWVKNGKGHLIYICNRDKVKFSKNGVGLPFRFVYPAREYDVLLPMTLAVMDKLIKAYGIENGPLAVQNFFDGKNIVVNEATMRFFGSGDHRAALFGNQLKAEDLLIEYAMGKKYDDLSSKSFKRYQSKFGRIVVQLQLYAKEGKIKYINGIEKIQQNEYVQKVELYYKPKQTIVNRGGNQSTVGMLFFMVDDYEEIEELTMKLTSQIEIISDIGENLLYIFDKEKFTYL